jgi:hypothetical protein
LFLKVAAPDNTTLLALDHEDERVRSAGVDAFGEPTVDRSDEIVSLVPLSLIAPCLSTALSFHDFGCC